MPELAYDYRQLRHMRTRMKRMTVFNCLTVTGLSGLQRSILMKSFQSWAFSFSIVCPPFYLISMLVKLTTKTAITYIR